MNTTQESQATVIPPTISVGNDSSLAPGSKRRVAVYARVATNEEPTSYTEQVANCAEHIQANPEWELVEVYTDEGVSVTSKKNRDGFNRMIQDALDGKIDLIVTKSVSRFARNTEETLAIVRKLKEKGIGVYFESERVDTLDSKGELLIEIMHSMLQEELRSLREHPWGPPRPSRRSRSVSCTEEMRRDAGDRQLYVMRWRKSET